MAFTDSFTAMPEQFLDALGVTQQMILTGATAMVSSARSLTPVMPAMPFADKMPDAVGITDGMFAFAEKVLASQRDFSCKLIETYLPTAPAPKATPAKSAAK